MKQKVLPPQALKCSLIPQKWLIYKNLLYSVVWIAVSCRGKKYDTSWPPEVFLRFRTRNTGGIVLFWEDYRLNSPCICIFLVYKNWDYWGQEQPAVSETSPKFHMKFFDKLLQVLLTIQRVWDLGIQNLFL